MFGDDDPTKSAEDKMSDAIGCVITTVIVLVIGAFAVLVGCVETVRHITWH
jgi:hypothetical protein